MAYKNTSQVKVIIAWDTVNNVYKTGDSANITVRGIGDGAEYTPAAPNVTEIDSTNLPGRYSVALAAGENNYKTVTLGGKSSTSGIAIFGPQWDNEMNANVAQLLGTAWLTPGTAGTPDVNVKSINAISAAAVTTIKAVLGLAVDGVVTTVTNQLTAAQIATGIWQDTTAGDFTTALSVGKSLMNGVSLGTGLKIAECVLADTVTIYTGNTPQTGDAYARLGAPAGASVSADIAAVRTDTNTTIPALIAALNNVSTAQVKAQVVAALSTDTYAEPGQGTPAATTDLRTKIGYIYKALINKMDQTATLFELYNNAGAVVDQKSTVSDDGTTFTRGNITTGP